MRLLGLKKVEEAGKYYLDYTVVRRVNAYLRPREHSFCLHQENIEVNNKKYGCCLETIFSNIFTYLFIIYLITYLFIYLLTRDSFLKQKTKKNPITAKVKLYVIFYVLPQQQSTSYSSGC